MSKSIIISGAAGNLGRAVTQKLLNEGYHVDATLSPRDNPDFIKSSELHSQIVNLLDEAAAADYVQSVAQSHEEICGAVLIVGGFAAGSIQETDASALQKMYQLNFETAYFLVRPLLKVLEGQENGGQIVFIGSRSAFNPQEGKDLVGKTLLCIKP